MHHIKQCYRYQKEALLANAMLVFLQIVGTICTISSGLPVRQGEISEVILQYELVFSTGTAYCGILVMILRNDSTIVFSV